MSDEFSSTLAQWQSFQGLAGASAATLLGLLFVSASIRPELFVHETHPELLSVGQKSMGMLLVVTIIALVFLLPSISPSSMGTALGITALIALFNTSRQFAIAQRLLREWGMFFVARRILLPSAGYVLLLAVSIALYLGEIEWLSLLGGV